MKKPFINVVTAISLVMSSSAFAAGPGSGSETKYNLSIGSCQVDSITTKWRLDSLMGEATVSGSYKWSGDSGCKLPHSTTVWLQVVNGSGGRGYVSLKPVTPKSDAGYGYDTTGSPSWSRALCGFNGTSRADCYSADQAKLLWKDSHVDDFFVEW
jgi:hypothetical protein